MFVNYLINNIILLIIFYWYNSKLFKWKKVGFFQLTITLIMLLTKCLLNLVNIPHLNLIVTIFVYFIISFLFFYGSNLKKIIFIGFFLISSFVSEIITYIIFEGMVNYIIYLKNSFINLFVGNIICSCILLLLSYYVTKVNDIRDLSDNNTITPLIILPILTILILLAETIFEIVNISPEFSILVTVILLVFNVIICLSFKEMIRLKNIQIENEKLLNKELHHQLLEEKFENSKKFVHDFKKHINVLYELVSTKEYKELEEYLNELASEIKREENFVMTGNQIVDLILHSKQSEIGQNKIEVKCEVKTKNIEPINYLDFNIIFSNIIDNAIESCVMADGHFIKIKLDRQDNIIVLKVINPCLKVSDNFKSMKNNNEYHGYGIKNIKRTAEKYNGMCNFEYDQSNSIFISTVILNTNEK